jgi:hypothetical protein
MSERATENKSAPSTGVVAETLREFATADPRSLGLFRIAFGIFLLVDLYRRLSDYVLFYTNEGMLPNHSAIYRPMSGHLFSLYHAFSTRREVAVAFALTAVVYVLYTIGWKTKVFQLVTLLLVTSLHSRNIMLENGGDVVANILAMWTCFLPLGKRFSVDAMVRSLRARHEITQEALDDRCSPLAPTGPIVSLAFACQILNLAVIYYFNTVQKDGPAWRTGVSVHYVLWADRLVQPLGVWVRGWVPLALVRVLTIGTLVMEASITLLLVSPIWIRACRRVAGLMIIALHCGFQTVGHFGMFSFAMMLHSILLLGPEDWDALAARMKRALPRRRLYFDASEQISWQLARIVKRLDPLGKISLVASDRATELPADVTFESLGETTIVTDGSGTRVFRDGAAVTALLRAIPYGVGLARLLELPGIFALSSSVHAAYVARRSALSRSLLTKGVNPPQEPIERSALFGPWVPRAAFALTLLMAVALSSQVLAENRRVPAWMKPAAQPALLAEIAQYPRFFQGWSMFAPVPPNDDGRLVVDAITIDGRHIDPLAGGGAVDFELPPESQGMLMTQFWYELHDRERRDQNSRYRDHLRDYLAAWQSIEGRPARDKIVSFEMYWVWRPTQPPGSRTRLPTQRQRILAWPEPSTH